MLVKENKQLCLDLSKHVDMMSRLLQRAADEKKWKIQISQFLEKMSMQQPQPRSPRPTLRVSSPGASPSWRISPLPAIGTLPVLPLGIPNGCAPAELTDVSLVIFHRGFDLDTDELDGCYPGERLLRSFDFDTPSEHSSPN
jgi:hypothetical protein